MIFFLLFLIAPIYSFNIKCNYGIGNYDQLGDVYNCYVGETNWGNAGDFKATSTSGTHLSGKSNSHVKLIIFTQSNFPSVPKNLRALFPNFVGMFFYYCDNFKRLTGTEFNEYPNLTWLAVFYSNIRHIPGNLFSKNPNMIFLRFAFSDVTQIGENLFNYSSKWQKVNLDNNACINEHAQSASQMPSLKSAIKSKCPDRCTTKAVEVFACDLNTNINNLKTDVTNLKNRVTTVESRVSNLNSTSINHQSKIQSLETKSNNLQTEVNTLKANMTTVNNKVEDLIDDNQIMMIKVNNLEIKVEVLEGMNKNLTSFVETLEKDVANLKDENEVLQSEVDEMKPRISEVEAKNQELEAENQKMKDTLDEHAAVLIELERIILDLTSRPCAC